MGCNGRKLYDKRMVTCQGRSLWPEKVDGGFPIETMVERNRKAFWHWCQKLSLCPVVNIPAGKTDPHCSTNCLAAFVYCEPVCPGRSHWLWSNRMWGKWMAAGFWTRHQQWRKREKPASVHQAKITGILQPTWTALLLGAQIIVRTTPRFITTGSHWGISRYWSSGWLD